MADAFDTAGACEAMLRQFQTTNALVATLSAEQAWLPTRLGSWRVIELVAHLTSSLDLVLNAVSFPSQGLAGTSPLLWYRNVDEFADVIAAEARSAAEAGWRDIQSEM